MALGRIKYFCALAGCTLLSALPPEIRRVPHAGSRSTQPFARGFELDLGAEFAADVDGIPLNTPGHVLGPGHLDTNIVIPELLAGSDYAKGSYLGGQGASAVAGSASSGLVSSLEEPILAFTYGGALADRYARLVWAEHLEGPRATYALDILRNERPWNDPFGSARLNLAYRREGGNPREGWSFTALGSEEKTDGGAAKPGRPLDAAALDDARAGDGSWNQRLLLGWRHHREDAPGRARRIQLYGGAHLHRDWHNWTLHLADPVQGDQRQHLDRRAFLGADASQAWSVRREAVAWVHAVGFQGRADRVEGSVRATRDRALLADSPFAPNQAQGHLLHGAVYAQSDLHWGRGWHARFALRVDGAAVRLGDVTGSWTPGNGSLVLGSPRAGLFWSPVEEVLMGVQAGCGLRRGDPFREPRPLSRSRSAEALFQATPVKAWTFGITLWTLRLESETLFDPPSGAVRAGGPARHRGVETHHEIRRGPWAWELAWAWTSARFEGLPRDRAWVPGSVPHTGYAAVVWKGGPWQAEARLRRTGARPLTPDAAQVAPAQDSLELRVQQEFVHWVAGLEVQNAFSRRTLNRAFHYASRLPGEVSPVRERHLKTADPQAIRMDLRRRF